MVTVYSTLFDDDYLVVYKNFGTSYFHCKLHLDEVEKVMHLCQPNLLGGTSIINIVSDGFVQSICEQLSCLENKDFKYEEYALVIYYSSDCEVRESVYAISSDGVFDFGGRNGKYTKYVPYLIECLGQSFADIISTQEFIRDVTLSEEVTKVLKLKNKDIYDINIDIDYKD